MTTDTPRTDAALVDHMPECSEWSQHYLDLSTFARQIERELAISLENQCKAQAEVERLRELVKYAVWVLKSYNPKYAEEIEASLTPPPEPPNARAEKAESEVEKLKIRLEEAIEIAEDLSSGDAWKFTAADEKLAALKGEIK
jgi:hypothetical protein